MTSKKNPAWLVLILISLAAVGCGGGGSSSATPPNASLFLNASPDPLALPPGAGLTVTITASTLNTTGTPTVSLGPLPSGFSTPTTFPLTVGSNGASFVVQAAANVADGQYTLVLQGSAGSASDTLNIPVTVGGTVVPFGFATPLFSEVQVQTGGSGTQQFSTYIDTTGPAQYDVALSVSGLPAGTTATVNPSLIVAGQSGTVTITATASAATAQNAVITLTGTPMAPTPSASTTFLLDVTPPPGSLPTNRTDYISTEGTPFAAVYDPAHGLIFSSNPSWNRIDVISATTKSVKAISIPNPQGIDIAPDNSSVWVTTNSQEVFKIDPTSFATSHYFLPNYSDAPAGWVANQLFVLSDGTILFGGQTGLVVWNPSTNTLTGLSLPTPSGGGIALPGIMLRSGDGTRVYSIADNSSGDSFYYNVASKSISGVVQLGGYGIAAAVNFDGSRVAVFDSNGLNMYDGNLNLLGPLPGGGTLATNFQFEGGMAFSNYTGQLYEVCMPTDIPVILTIDSNSLQLLNAAPAMPMIPVMTELAPSFYMPEPFAIDDTGMVLGIEDYGIAFDDSTFTQNFVSQQPGSPVFLQHMSPYSGPLSGHTTSSGFGNSFSITPDIWYGPNRGTASIDSSNLLSITSPPSNSPGPVNLKFMFPDGTEAFDPLFFSYGPEIQYNSFSGATPSGSVPGRISGWGMPVDAGGGTLSVGGSTAAITSTASQYLPFTGSPFSTTFLDFTIPAGNPGWADIRLTTPDGTATLPKSLFYAKSVQDYTSADTFSSVLFDPGRNQLYLSAGDHIDVFSLASKQFLSPFTPPAEGASKQFAGLALTPDGSRLLAADLLDGTLAATDPDNPSMASVMSIVPPPTPNSSCMTGPVYVAALVGNQALVATGGLPGIGCGPGGSIYLADLATGTAAAFPGARTPSCNSPAGYVAATRDGTKAAMGGTFCIYDAVQKAFYGTNSNQYPAATISGDGNVAASQLDFDNVQGLIVGRVAQPAIYFGYPALSGYVASGTGNGFSLFNPQLNDPGSLYFVPYPTFFDIVDVQHGLLRIRFSLSETISDAAVPMAINSDGSQVYLITNKGLTIVDLGEAPLSIGYLNPQSVSPGGQTTIGGSGFTPSTTATVGGIAATVSYVDDETLTLDIPGGVTSGPSDVILTNSDGTSYTLQDGLTIP